MAVDGAVGDAAPVGPPPEIVAEAKRVEAILSGDVTIRLNLEFLFRNNKTDLAILRATKTATETRVSALHSATVFANGLMHAGTSVDAFLRENLEWLARATNWAKFSAVATLGMIHKVRRGARRGGGGGGDDREKAGVHWLTSSPTAAAARRAMQCNVAPGPHLAGQCAFGAVPAPAGRHGLAVRAGRCALCPGPHQRQSRR